MLLLLMCWVTAAFGLRRSNDTELAGTMLKKAKIIMADEEYDDALKKLKRIISDFPDNSKVEEAMATLNHCYQIIGYLDEAFEYYKEVRRKHPGTKAAVMASYHAVPILIRRQQYDEAIIRCNEIILADAKSYWAIGSLFNMAKLYCHQLGRKKEGMKMYKKIIKKYPSTQFAKIAEMELKMLQMR